MDFDKLPWEAALIIMKNSHESISLFPRFNKSIERNINELLDIHGKFTFQGKNYEKVVSKNEGSFFCDEYIYYGYNLKFIHKHNDAKTCECGFYLYQSNGLNVEDDFSQVYLEFDNNCYSFQLDNEHQPSCIVKQNYKQPDFSEPFVDTTHYYFVKNEKRNLPDKPSAITFKDGLLVGKYWFKYEFLHNLNGPAVEMYEGGKRTFKWYFMGRRHRKNGPAIEIYEKGKLVHETWILLDLIHREDGPAITDYIKNEKTWYTMNKINNLDGPAFISGDTEGYFIFGMQCDSNFKLKKGELERNMFELENGTIAEEQMI